MLIVAVLDLGVILLRPRVYERYPCWCELRLVIFSVYLLAASFRNFPKLGTGLD